MLGPKSLILSYQSIILLDSDGRYNDQGYKLIGEDLSKNMTIWKGTQKHWRIKSPIMTGNEIAGRNHIAYIPVAPLYTLSGYVCQFLWSEYTFILYPKKNPRNCFRNSYIHREDLLFSCSVVTLCLA